MLRYRYSYRTLITFSEDVFSHHFLLRCIPRESVFQKNIQSNCSVLPGDKKTVGADSFGNTVISGYLGDFHKFFEFTSEGIVEISGNKQEEQLNPIFLYKSKLTQPMGEIHQLCENLEFTGRETIHEKIFMISNHINRMLTYVPGITSVHTSAEEALQLGRGVCQDFAHVMIAVCREKGIAARYVNGFMEGEGFTHAWLEYYCQGAWFGFDPTHNRPADVGYIKLSHGRDYHDCVIDKGVFRGLAQQNLEVYLKVEQIQQ